MLLLLDYIKTKVYKWGNIGRFMENRITLCSNCMAIKDKDSQGNELWKSVNCGIASDTCPEEIGILTAPYNQLLTDYRYKISHGYCPPCFEKVGNEIKTISKERGN